MCQSMYPVSCFTDIHIQCPGDKRYTIPGTALIAEPCSASFLIVEAKTIFTATDRARLMAIFQYIHAQRWQNLSPVTAGSLHGLTDFHSWHDAVLPQCKTGFLMWRTHNSSITAIPSWESAGQDIRGPYSIRSESRAQAISMPFVCPCCRR